MLQSYKSKSVHISDNGIFPDIALLWSKHAGRVTYTTPWINGFPSSMQTEIGEGFAEFERVDDIHEIIDETDLFVFPDIYYSHVQADLLARGKRVWGSRDAEELEIYRSRAKPAFDKLSIPQGPYEIIDAGITKLRQYIKDHGDRKLWIKIDKTRGDFETFSVEPGEEATAYELYKNKLDDVETKLGPKAEITVFVVEDNLEDTIDLAIDTHCVDGVYPSVAILGTEEKGEAYVGIVKPWDKMPAGLVSIYDKLSPSLKGYQYRAPISLESRVKGKAATLGDPCMRYGSPPEEVEMEWITNQPDIMWFGAEGKMIDPKFDGNVGVQLNVHSDWCCDHPLMIDYPKKYKDNVKFRYNSVFKGRMWIMPQGAGPRCAAIVSHGNSLDDCMEECKEISAQFKGIQIESFSRSFPVIKERIATLKSWGVW
jgi:hypothetical protein